MNERTRRKGFRHCREAPARKCDRTRANGASPIDAKASDHAVAKSSDTETTNGEKQMNAELMQTLAELKLKHAMNSCDGLDSDLHQYSNSTFRAKGCP